MYCVKCGKAIADDAVSCPYCGAMVDGSDNPFADNENVYSMPATVPVYQAVPVKRKKKKTGLIIAIIVICLALIGGGLYAGHWYYNRPIMLITKAIEENDIQTLVDLFDELDKDVDIEYVEKSMASYATQLQKDFVNYDKDYDEVMEELELLGKDILKGNSRYDRIISDIEDLNRSRKNFEEAEKAFKKEDYEKASELYSQVSMHDDEHYQNAKDKIEEIKKLMIPDVIGTWRTTIDMAPALLSQANLNSYNIDPAYLSSIYFPLDLLLVIEEDNKCSLQTDYDKFLDDADTILDSLLDFAFAYFAKQYGMSVEDLEKLSMKLYGKDLRSAFMDELNIDEIKQEAFDSAKVETSDCFYDIEGDKLYLYRDESDMKRGSDNAALCFTLYDNTISIERNTTSLPYALELCIEYPLIFTKDN